MNISILRKKLNEKEEEESNTSNKGYYSWFTSTQQRSSRSSPLIEHCELVLFFLESRIGRISGELDGQQRRRKERERLIYSSTRIKSTSASVSKSNGHNVPYDDNSAHTSSAHTTQLQLENSRMVEEMSRGLFESLNSTETQILEISRLQSTLQTHLTIQHDQTVRLFEDSISVVSETRRGNEYLRRSGKEGSAMRRFLVGLILLMSLLLLFLHYYK